MKPSEADIFLFQRLISVFRQHGDHGSSCAPAHNEVWGTFPLSTYMYSNSRPRRLGIHTMHVSWRGYTISRIIIIWILQNTKLV